MAAIKAARRETKDKRADARLKALELRAEGMELSEVSQATGFHAAYVSQLVAKYRDHGLEAISGNHYGGNHRNMSFEEEAAILAPFKKKVVTKTIKKNLGYRDLEFLDKKIVFFIVVV